MKEILIDHTYGEAKNYGKAGKTLQVDYDNFTVNLWLTQVDYHLDYPYDCTCLSLYPEDAKQLRDLLNEYLKEMEVE